MKHRRPNRAWFARTVGERRRSSSGSQCGSISKNGDTSDTCAKVEARSRLVTICAKTACIHVVPDLGYEHTNTSVDSVAKF